MIWTLFLASCSNNENTDNEPLRKELDLVISVLETSIKDNKLILNIKLKNISSDTIYILSEQSTYFHKQFQFDLTSEGKHYVFLNKKNTYSSFKDSIMLLDKDTITFKLNLLENYNPIPKNIEELLKEGELCCYFNSGLEIIEREEYPYKIKLTGNNISNELKLN